MTGFKIKGLRWWIIGLLMLGSIVNYLTRSTPDSPQTDAFTPPIGIPAGKRVHLRVEIDYERLHFAYRVEGVDNDWRWLPQQFDASILSDEACVPGTPNFTGAFVGMACQDMSGTARPADFDFFEYRERSYRANPFETVDLI